MSDIKKRLKALLEQREDTEPTGLIIGTDSGFMVFSFGDEAGKKFPDFATEQEARDALFACGITKIGVIACD